MFDDIVLEDDQKALLAQIVEAERSVPKEKRGRFLVAQLIAEPFDTFIHPGGPRLEGHFEDVEILAGAGLVTIGYTSQGTPNFYVTPTGFRYYAHLKTETDPEDTVQNDIRRYVGSHLFQRDHPRSLAKWSQAERLLWGSDSTQQLTTVGHLCREAMQEFGDEVLALYSVPEPYPPKLHTVARLRAVVASRRPATSSTVAALFDALIGYWGAVADLAQRQEHGAEREAEDLRWEDARRLVFQTVTVFYEIHRALRWSQSG
jgi:hypothetical protein